MGRHQTWLKSAPTQTEQKNIREKTKPLPRLPAREVAKLADHD